MTTIADIAAEVRKPGLAVYGVAHDANARGDPYRSVVLLGPATGFWDVFTLSPEYRDGDPDPLDRWSRRVISRIAQSVEAEPLFPFGGPPYQPFPGWALESGRCWASPVGLLVHDHTGLMISFRGALGFEFAVDEDISSAEAAGASGRPCNGCSKRPCVSACPVGALSESGYDVDRCKAFLRTAAGHDCMERGCAVRRSCPISAGAGRPSSQSAFHMNAFL
ncbi:MAG: ferredoxin [Rhodobacteraceae bacterium]|nr:ferredoxin [Paracoccaceae bacterium]MCY4141097.1 ferredoxin [Paracoccaceae bacterium]